MAGTIRTCPSCMTLLLRDTMQCPECDHVLDQERHNQLSPTTTEDKQARPGPVEDACPTCSEHVRRGMVRCWNCGSFMREDIGDLYMKMQARPAPVIYSDDSGTEEIYEVESPGDAYFSDESSGEANDDFQLSADIASHVSDDDSADTYTLSTNAPQSEDPKTDTETTPAASPESSTADSKSDEPSKVEETNGETQSSTDEEKPAKNDDADEPSTEPHSVATGGDALLQIAMEEELESDKRRKQPRKKQEPGRKITGFLVFCANGHRIEVQDRHRGKAGRCPRCKSLFIVPEKTRESEQAPDSTATTDEKTTNEAAAASQGAGRFTRWMTDVHLHTVNPEKLRLKAGSLQKAFELVDLGFSAEDVLLAKLPAAKSLFGRSSTGNDAREALLTSLREETPDDDLPVAEKRLIAADAIQQFGIDQPVIYEHESMFVGIPVFGPGRIAVRLPKIDANDLPTFLSFNLSDFREFSQTLGQFYGLEEFGSLNEIPLTDEFTQQTCHYSEEKFRSVENVEFYEADEKCTLKLVGRKCAECGLVVSEDSRKKEKIGGANGRGIAKAACPKCKKKFGNISLFDLEATTEPAAADKADAAEETPTAKSETKTE